MPTFTGLHRNRTTTRLVRWSDRVARVCITGGGIGTILAVGLVCAFLVWVVLPLLWPARTALATDQHLGGGPASDLLVDEYRQAAVVLQRDGVAVALQFDGGVEFGRRQLFAPATTVVCARHGERVLLGQRDGSLALATLQLRSDLVEVATLPANVAERLATGRGAVVGEDLYAPTDDGQCRRQHLDVAVDQPLATGSAAIALADFTEQQSGPMFAALTADGALHLRARSERTNLLTGEVEQQWRGGDTDLRSLAPNLPPLPPDQLLVTGSGDNVLLLWRDGLLLRFDGRDLQAPRLAERLDLLPEDTTRITALGFLIGGTTLLVGDSQGDITGWFRTKPEGARGTDGAQLERAFVHHGQGRGAVTALAASSRSRLFVAGYQNGAVRVLHGTSERLVADLAAPTPAAVTAVVLAPKEDGIAAVAGDRVAAWSLLPGHPEVSLHSIFLPVWYEGYARPEHVWQATGGTDDFEPKFGLWPLIFGTLKATFYCLLFGVPLALLAALYTSEFLHARTKARVKPLIEMMASLPSVVLGFLAALVFAPIAEALLPALLALVFALPLVLLVGGQIWQALPERVRVAAERRRLLAVFVALPLAALVAVTAGPLLETWLFGGDLKAWLANERRPAGDAGRGSAFGGWFVLLLPFGSVAVALLLGWLPVRRRFAQLVGWLPFFNIGAGANVARFACGLIVAILLTTGVAALITAGGADLRGNLVGTYVQRNALIVGFVMGFAVIPIVYTLAEDALSAVPDHLRAASLGAGASPWQTAVRIVLPTAMSGIFSAVMVGLGRAVGETMIVLMAAGNTPVLQMNLFNGFRTLSANIAVELPEAVRDSTHYRMLYLAALCLFAMTFVLNTVAEAVRQRFRRRAFQL